MTLKPYTVACGNNHNQVIYNHEAHSPQQFEAVYLITQRPDFDFTCFPWNPFEKSEDGKEYHGPINYLFFDKADCLHLVKVGVRGKILREITTEPVRPRRS